MPRLASWMEAVDVDVLEFLDGREDPAEPATIADDLEYVEAYVKRRLDELAAQGLVQPVTGGGYVLRPLGEEYLAGELEPHFLDGPED